MINSIKDMIKTKQLIEHAITLILEYIEIWEDSLQIAFAAAIENTFNPDSILDKFEVLEENNLLYEDEIKMSLIYSNTVNIANLILKFCMKIISTEVSNVRMKLNDKLQFNKKFN